MTLPSYITSIEHHSITITGTSNSANLGGSVNVANCVPFISVKIDDTSDDWSDIMIDCYFTAGSPPTVTVARDTSGGTAYVSVFVVEFDGTNVEVQQGTFDIDMFSTWDSQEITAVTLAKAFIVSVYEKEAGNDDWEGTMVETSFTDSDTVYFEKSDGNGDCHGHFYVVEAQGTEFSVQTANPDIAEAKYKEAIR